MRSEGHYINQYSKDTSWDRKSDTFQTLYRDRLMMAYWHKLVTNEVNNKISLCLIEKQIYLSLFIYSTQRNQIHER